jgi:hypothetical protein
VEDVRCTAPQGQNITKTDSLSTKARNTTLVGWGKSTAEWLMLMLIYYERKILLNDWLIMTDKFKRTECTCHF